MVVDLDLLDGALGDLTELLDGADLDKIAGPDLGTEAVTVEAFAMWIHGRMAAALGAVGGATLSVRVWESETMFGGYTAPLGSVHLGSA